MNTVEWHFIIKTFQFFGFGQSMVNWIRCFYNKVESCILNNGWTSEFFTLERGVRQDYPLSPYLFALALEVLAKVIRNSKGVEGIMVNRIFDTSPILNGSEMSFISVLCVLDNFHKISRLKKI